MLCLGCLVFKKKKRQTEIQFQQAQAWGKFMDSYNPNGRDRNSVGHQRWLEHGPGPQDSLPLSRLCAAMQRYAVQGALHPATPVLHILALLLDRAGLASQLRKKSLEAPGLCLEWLGHSWDQEQNWKRTYRTSSLGVGGAVLNYRWLVPEKRKGNSGQMTDVHYRPRLHTFWLRPSHISSPLSCLPSIAVLIQKTRCNSTLVY